MSDANPIRRVDFHIPSSRPPEAQNPSPPSSDIQEVVDQLQQELAPFLKEKNHVLSKILKTLTKDVYANRTDRPTILNLVHESQEKIEKTVFSMRTELAPVQEHQLQTIAGDKADAAWREIEKGLLQDYDAGDRAEQTLQTIMQPHIGPGKIDVISSPTDLVAFLAGLKGKPEEQKLSSLQYFAYQKINEALQKKYGENASISTVGLYSNPLRDLCNEFFAAKDWKSALEVFRRINDALQ